MIILLLFFSAAVNSDASIKSVIDQINTALAHHDKKTLAAQFTPDANLWVEGKKMESSREGVLSTFQEHQPWTDSSHARLKNVNVVSTSAAKAVVHADEVRAETPIASVELILVHRNEKWLVDSVRVLSVAAGAH
jgi:uncharacterized protein (TIGR02246 family)